MFEPLERHRLAADCGSERGRPRWISNWRTYRAIPLDGGLDHLALRTGLELNQRRYVAASLLAPRGGTRARKNGLVATSCTVAENRDVADTLVRVVRELTARVVVLPAPEYRTPRFTSRGVVNHAPCPVLVVRGAYEEPRRAAGDGPRAVRASHAG